MGYKILLTGSMIYVSLESSFISNVALLGSPASFPDKIVAGPQYIQHWGLASEGAPRYLKRVRNTDLMEAGLRLQLILDVYAAQVTIRDVGMDLFYKHSSNCFTNN